MECAHAYYRAYIVGHFISSKSIEAPDDDSAVEAAQQFVDGHDIEVSHLDRKIAVLPSKD
jgi:hypothetical protein